MRSFFSLPTIKRWLQMLLLSFALYEVLWSVIQIQFERLSFCVEETLWDFAQCLLFTSAVFVVNWFFTRFRNGKYTQSIVEIACILVVCSLLIFLIDQIVYVQDTADDKFWNVIDIYIICIICSLLSLIDIQHTYHKKLVAIEQEQMKLRLNLLQQQLSPHFMFNSLSTLQVIIAVNPQKAEEYVITLSDILRYITENISKEKVALKDAINFIKSYTQMLNVRFPEHFIFNIETTTLPDAYIVPVSMQIAVENAIKHNSHSRKFPLEICIKSNGYSIEIRNKKRPTPFADSLGVGLKNLNERYILLTGKELDISEDSNYYSVNIPLIYESTDNRGRNI